MRGMADTPHCHCLVLERPVSGQAAVAFRRSACAETFRLRARLGGRWTSPLQPSLHAAVIPAARQRLLYCCVSVTALQGGLQRSDCRRTTRLRACATWGHCTTSPALAASRTPWSVRDSARYQLMYVRQHSCACPGHFPSSLVFSQLHCDSRNNDKEHRFF